MPTTAPFPSVASLGDRIAPVIATHIDLAFRALMAGPGVEITPRRIRLITGEQHPLANFVCMAERPGAEEIRAAMQPLTRLPAPSAALFTSPVPNDVADALRAAGYEAHAPMPAMAVNIENLAPTTLPSGYTLERVHTPAQRDAWAGAFTRGYELPSPIGPLFTAPLARRIDEQSPIQFFWITHHSAPVATSVLFLDQGVAGVYAVATLPEHRGKGLGAHITAEPLRLAAQRGYNVGVLQSSEAGHPVYQRLGFMDFGALPLYVRMPT